ncbi:hypothetical protein CU044_7326 [Streptomyces sp. L-9-10]|nr:hypothetical protein CU044_7326 [Streptomyces sp. L-9-10]
METEDALGPAGGAGGVDDIRGVARGQGHPRRTRGQRGDPVAQTVDGDDGAVEAVRQRSGERVHRDRDPDPALGEHPRHAVLRKRRVQRQIRSARLEHGQDGDDEIDATRQADRDRLLGADPAVDQVVRQSIGALVELTVRQGFVVVTAGQRGRVGCAVGLLGEARRDGAGGRLGPRDRLALGEQSGQFVGGEQLGLVQSPVGGGDQGTGQYDEMPSQPFDGGRVEQVGAVFDRAMQLLFLVLLEFPAHVVRGFLAGEGSACHADALEFGGFDRGVLEHHHRLDEWCTRGVAFRREDFHQPLEGNVLVLECLQYGLPYLGKEFGERTGLVDTGAQHQNIDEESDEILHLGPLTPGYRRADRYVVLAAVPGHQQLSDRGERDEEAGSLLAARVPDPRGDIGGQGEGVDGAGAAADRRTGAVGGQFQRLQTVQPLTPVTDMAVQRAAGEPPALPGGEVGVLHRERRQPGRADVSAQGGGVVRPQLPDDDLHGGAVGDDVVHGEQEAVLVGADADEQGTHQRACAQVVRLGHRRGDQPVGVRRVGQVHEAERQLGLRTYDLPRHPLLRGEGGAQRLVPGHDGVERRPERADVQRAGEPQAETGIVLRGVPLILRHEPEPLLSERQRERSAAVHGLDGVPAAARATREPAPESLLHVLRQRTDPGLARRSGVHGKLPHIHIMKTSRQKHRVRSRRCFGPVPAPLVRRRARG